MKQIDYKNTGAVDTELGSLLEGYRHSTILLKILIEIYSNGFKVYVKPRWLSKAHIFQFKWKPEALNERVEYRVYMK